jgi:hypothetical protein
VDELVKQVSVKAGITEAQARIAVDTVIAYAKAKLPPAFASQVDGVISGKTNLNGLGGMLGGLFGSK